MRPNPRPILALALLSLLTILVHGRAIRFDFVGYDDPQRILENPFVRDGMSWHGLSWAFTTTEHAPYWHPLAWLSHMLDCEIHGLAPAGHHATNVLLHLASVLTLYAFLLRATGERGPSLAAAALFALHPVNAGTVAWVSARPDLLAGLFSLVGLWAHVAHRRGLALAAFGAALLSKPTASVLPLVMLLVDRWPLGDGRHLAVRLREKAPWLGLAALGAASVFFDVERVGGVAESLRVGLLPRLANAAVSAVRYLGHALWPVGLTAHYPHPNLGGGRAWSALEIGAALVALAAITAVALGRTRLPFLRTGWLWYAAALVPVLGLIQVGDQALADRYLYFPGIGLWIAAAWSAARALAAMPYAARTALVAVGAPALALLLAWGTWHEASPWRDSRALFSRALAIYPDDPVMHYDLALTLERAGEHEAAESHYRRAVDVRPADARAHNNLGNLLQARGRASEALAHFRRAVELAPTFAVAWNNLGNSLREAGQLVAAIDAYERALAIEPAPPEARRNLAAALAAAGREEEAAARYREYLENEKRGPARAPSSRP